MFKDELFRCGKRNIKNWGYDDGHHYEGFFWTDMTKIELKLNCCTWRFEMSLHYHCLKICWWSLISIYRGAKNQIFHKSASEVAIVKAPVSMRPSLVCSPKTVGKYIVPFCSSTLGWSMKVWISCFARKWLKLLDDFCVNDRISTFCENKWKTSTTCLICLVKTKWWIGYHILICECYGWAMDSWRCLFKGSLKIDVVAFYLKKPWIMVRSRLLNHYIFQFATFWVS